MLRFTVVQRDSLEQAATKLPTLTAVVAADKKVRQLWVPIKSCIDLGKQCLIPVADPSVQCLRSS